MENYWVTHLYVPKTNNECRIQLRVTLIENNDNKDLWDIYYFSKANADGIANINSQ